jgi:fatty-acyl-CoA synthase
MAPGGLAYREELTPTSFLERAGTVHERRTAVIDGAASWTYGDWRARARRFAHALRSAGLRRGDRVAFLALNSEPLLLAHFAVPLAGGVLVAINTRLTAREVCYIVDHSGSRFLFFSPELEDQLAEVPQGVERIALGPPFESFLSAGIEDPVPSWLEDEYEPLAIDYTSGTTGSPKGVVYHHRGAHLNALGMVLENRLRRDSVCLWTLPMFHCNGWCHTWGVVAAGATSVCLPRVEPPRVWEMLDTHGVTHFNAAPTVLIMLANDAGARRLQRPARVCVGGAPPSPTLLAQLAALNIEVVHLYGLTESYGPALMNVPPPGFHAWSPDAQAVYQARQGVPHVTAGHARVVDADLQDVPADGASMGEVVLRGNTLMQGYFRDDEATDRAFAGGWFHTGDVGVMHEDGSVELRDRQKDVVISGGENIATIEVEQAVMSHPAVLEAAVVAVPDETWGETPKAYVTLREGRSATEEEIVAHCRERLAHFKCPRHVEFGDLPRTSTGKIQKYLLRERAWEGRERRVN